MVRVQGQCICQVCRVRWPCLIAHELRKHSADTPQTARK